MLIAEVAVDFDNFYTTKRAAGPPLHQLNSCGCHQETFAYNGCSKLVEWNRGGQIITYDYDTLDRLTALHSPSTEDELSWSYDELSRVKKMNDGSEACTDYTYTAKRPAQDHHPLGRRGLTYNYDAGDRLQRLEDHEGDTTDPPNPVERTQRTPAGDYDAQTRRLATLELQTTRSIQICEPARIVVIL